MIRFTLPKEIQHLLNRCRFRLVFEFCFGASEPKPKDDERR